MEVQRIQFMLLLTCVTQSLKFSALRRFVSTESSMVEIKLDGPGIQNFKNHEYFSVFSYHVLLGAKN